MVWLKFFFSFRGRVDRQGYAIGLLLSVILTGIAVLLTYAILGATFSSLSTTPMTSANQVAQQAAHGQFMMKLLSVGLAMLPLFFVAFASTLALSARRLHDLNKSAWWMLAPLGVDAGALVLSFVSAPIGSIAHLVALAFSVWLTVQIMFFKGTDGSNHYGPGGSSLSGLVGGKAAPEAEPEWVGQAIRRTTVKAERASTPVAAPATRAPRITKLAPISSPASPVTFGRRARPA